MKKPPKVPPGSERRQHGNLTEEDAELWGFVTRSVKRLDVSRPERRGRVPQQVARDVEHEKSPAQQRQAEALAVPSMTPKRQGPQRHNSPPEFDRREARHIARGRIEIEAHVDLHGLRQAEAHRRLLTFLRNAYNSGQRHVLVITGKGRFDDEHHTLPFHETLDRAPRGILRRSVPLWLEEPSLREIVLSFREAAGHHGGAGALYVRLRSAYKGR